MGDINRREKAGEQKQKSKGGDLTALERDMEQVVFDSDLGDNEDTAICPLCVLVYCDMSGVWIGCNSCDAWFDLKCTDVVRLPSLC